jgi:phosphoadenosine phosphosulfate reductase
MRKALGTEREDETIGREGLARVSEHLEDSSPQDILRWAVSVYGEDLTLSVSFGNPEGMVLLDMLTRITDKAQVFTLDTGFLFEETVRFREEAMKKYPLPLKVLTPGLTVEEQVAHYGPKLYSCAPDLCCEVRKIAPQRRFLRDYGAWVTGIRRDQTTQRADTPVLSWEERFGVVKIAPLVNWSTGEVEEYVCERGLPLNPLLGRGYKSIGCAPCTQPVSEAEDARAGRWPGMDKTECGLHFVGGAIKRANP